MPPRSTTHHVMDEMKCETQSLMPLFLFPGLNALQRHVPRVSRAITKVVKLMDRPANAAEYLQVLGKIHHQMGITVSLAKLLRHP